MPWSGSTFSRTDGTRTGATVFQDEADAGIDIEATNLDTEAQDMADGLEECLKRTGGNVMTADLAMGAKKVTNLADGTAQDDGTSVGQVQDSRHVWGGTAGGTNNALTVTLIPAVTTLTAGLILRFLANTTNTTAATISINGISAVAIQKRTGSALDGGEMTASHLVEVIYTGSAFRLMGLSSADISWGNDNTLNIRDGGGTANAGPLQDLRRESGSPADADKLAQIRYIGRNVSLDPITYAKLSAVANDVSDGTEDGSLGIAIIRDGALVEMITIGQTSGPATRVFADGEVPIEIRRDTSNGGLLQFSQGGTTAGVIRSVAGNSIEFVIDSPNDVRVFSQSGAPTAAYGDGSLCTRTDATDGDDALYVRVSGAWVPILGATA